MKTWMGILATAVLWAGSGLAQPFAVPPGRWWERPRVAEQLGLTAEQKAKLDESSLAHAKAMIDLKAAVDKADLELKALADADPFEAQAVRSAFGTLQQARARLENQRFEMLLKVRELLSPDQWRRLKTMIRQFVEEKREDKLGQPGDRRFQRRVP